VVDGTTNLLYEWAFLTTHVDRALDFTNGDSRVVVSVIDSGVAHVPDLGQDRQSLERERRYDLAGLRGQR
jgi:hypothetical protein